MKQKKSALNYLIKLMRMNKLFIPYTIIVLSSLIVVAILYFLTLYCGVGVDIVSFIVLFYIAYRLHKKK